MAAEFIYGVHPVRQILDEDPLGILAVWVLLGSKRRVISEIRSVAEKNGITVMETSRRRLDDMVAGANHQGLLCKYRSTRIKLDLSGILKSSPQILLLVLDGIQDPHNLGAIARTAEVFGVHGLVVPSKESAKISPGAIRSSAGALEHIEFTIVNSISKSLDYLKKMNFQILSLDMNGENLSEIDIDNSLPIALVVGSEHDGISKRILENSDKVVSIPMSGEISSLNVSVATGITLYNLFLKRNING